MNNKRGKTKSIEIKSDQEKKWYYVRMQLAQARTAGWKYANNERELCSLYKHLQQAYGTSYTIHAD